MINRKTYPTKTKLHELFIYHEDGFLIRKSNNKLIGNKPQIKANYYTLSIDASSYVLHKCIYIMHQEQESFEDHIKEITYKNYLEKFSHCIDYENRFPYPTIEDLPSNFVVDHINRNKLDNKIQNLRLLTLAENFLNTDVKCNLSSFINFKKHGFPLRDVDGTH